MIDARGNWNLSHVRWCCRASHALSKTWGVEKAVTITVMELRYLGGSSGRVAGRVASLETWFVPLIFKWRIVSVLTLNPPKGILFRFASDPNFTPVSPCNFPILWRFHHVSIRFFVFMFPWNITSWPIKIEPVVIQGWLQKNKKIENHSIIRTASWLHGQLQTCAFCECSRTMQ